MGIWSTSPQKELSVSLRRSFEQTACAVLPDPSMDVIETP